MRGKLAKQIRRQVYGDQSHREREYEGGVVKRKGSFGEILGDGWKTLINKPGSLRHEYQHCKRFFKAYGK
jgi:hypothetical protein